MSMETASAKEAPSSGNIGAIQGNRQSATIRYCDRLDVAEIFVDSVVSLLVDAQSMRVEFGVTRLDEMKPNAPMTGRRYPACRIVLSSSAALDLMNRLRRVASVFANLPQAAPQPGNEPVKRDQNGSALLEQACLGL